MEFVKFKRAVHAQFNQLAAGADMLFLTNVDRMHYGIVILIPFRRKRDSLIIATIVNIISDIMVELSPLKTIK